LRRGVGFESDSVAKLAEERLAGDRAQDIESKRTDSRINIARRRLTLNQCCSLGHSKSFCNTIDPKADISLASLGSHLTFAAAI
jgi:hypothetical protein